MSQPSQLRVRRATTDDFDGLRALWTSAGLPAGQLEKRLTEFQVAEASDGKITGAIGVQIVRQHGLLHSEAYADASVADTARQLFWERIQLIASHYGVFRLWTQDTAPFWSERGFRIVIVESLVQLPEEWKRLEGKWYSLQLKNEEVIAKLEKELVSFRESEKEHTQHTLGQAKLVQTIITVIGFTVAFLCMVILFYWFARRNFFLPPH